MNSCAANDKGNILTMKEAQESGIRAQLVVLSCCHSGKGDIRSEGVVGIARAFLAAGARAVVASLWAIDDAATKVFMLKFYSHLKNGESASKSLQQAMKDMREIERYKEPKYWAAFFLIGDDVTITG
ncbi:tetratricopeptide repeat protein 28 [Exaiptasia diaphana]|uniref:CHAT domain-containing protein n=1 Tax=Exaiptasia diaphana TaxID=2652724 RepID=A0A913X3H2_EXADI|nr:tetratricopeptide repeat protein 28 [Exaiptasia diaphana]